MCRWLAYSGFPVQLERLLYTPVHSLIDQSPHSKLGLATSEGTTVWAFRYSSQGKSRSLFYSTGVSTLRELYPDLEVLRLVDDEARLIVSEPLRDLPGAWNEVPESTCGIVQPEEDELRPFAPAA